MTKMQHTDGLRTLAATELDLVSGGEIIVVGRGAPRPVGLSTENQQAIELSAELTAAFLHRRLTPI